MKKAREHRHTVRLSQGEEEVAQEVMQALDCKSIPEMFRWLLDHTQMPDEIKTIGNSGLTSRPPIWRYALRVAERDKLISIIERIKNAIHKGDR